MAPNQYGGLSIKPFLLRYELFLIDESSSGLPIFIFRNTSKTAEANTGRDRIG